MDKRLRHVLETIAREYKPDILKGSRHYTEVNIGQQADRLGYSDLKNSYGTSYAVIPLRNPQPGMKVRIDGRTFVNYAEYDSGVVLPGYVAKKIGGKYKQFVPMDSMICNFV